jgi:hypothetical protein
VVYIGGNQYVFALDAATGKNLWTFATGNTVQSSPAVVDGRVYVGSTDENVYGFGLADEILDSMKQAAPSKQVTEEQGPFFLADHVPLKSRVGRYEGTWMMVVAPTEATDRMPDANVLEITDHKWTLLQRDKAGSTRILAAGAY